MADSVSTLFLNDLSQPMGCIGHLLARARNKLAKSMDLVLAKNDITSTQAIILWLLSTGKFVTAGELARELVIDAASMTRMIDRLEKRKLAERLPRGDDRRVINLRLTPTGRVLAEQFPGIYSTVMSRSFAGFSNDEIVQLRGLLNKLVINHTSLDANGSQS
jgi:DNA-binding MarR family transcriptional regulator